MSHMKWGSITFLFFVFFVFGWFEVRSSCRLVNTGMESSKTHSWQPYPFLVKVISLHLQAVHQNTTWYTVNKDSRVRRKHGIGIVIGIGIGTVRRLTVPRKPLLFLALCQVRVQFRTGKWRENGTAFQKLQNYFFCFLFGKPNGVLEAPAVRSPLTEQSDSHHRLWNSEWKTFWLANIQRPPLFFETFMHHSRPGLIHEWEFCVSQRNVPDWISKQQKIPRSWLHKQKNHWHVKGHRTGRRLWSDRKAHCLNL